MLGDDWIACEVTASGHTLPNGRWHSLRHWGRRRRRLLRGHLPKKIDPTSEPKTEQMEVYGTTLVHTGLKAVNNHFKTTSKLL